MRSRATPLFNLESQMQSLSVILQSQLPTLAGAEREPTLPPLPRTRDIVRRTEPRRISGMKVSGKARSANIGGTSLLGRMSANEVFLGAVGFRCSISRSFSAG